MEIEKLQFVSDCISHLGFAEGVSVEESGDEVVFHVESLSIASITQWIALEAMMIGLSEKFQKKMSAVVSTESSDWRYLAGRTKLR